MVGVSKIVAWVKLTPSPEQAAVLASALGALNDHATWVAKVAHEQGVMRNYELRKHTYQQLREAGVGSQAAQHVIKKVCDAYRTRQSNLDNGNYGPKGSARRTRIESMPIAFRPESAHPYDARNPSFAMDARTISLWTFQGRLKDVPFVISLEDLTGIRIRVRQRRPQRVTLHTWSFHQPGQFIVYKARRTGVPVVFVDPAYTSQTCAGCGHVDHRNRVDQAIFICRGCGVVAHADRNASANIAARGRVVWNAGRKSHVPPDHP
jgi:IS605 OrfB family transposase